MAFLLDKYVPNFAVIHFCHDLVLFHEFPKKKQHVFGQDLPI
jgi:hypothetical protein